MEIDLIDAELDFDRAFVEFYIDSGPDPIEYMEFKLGGQQWGAFNQQFVIQTDDVAGYEQVKIMLQDFLTTDGQLPSGDWYEFTGDGQLLDRMSWGFGPTADLTVHIDSIRLADQDAQQLMPGDADQDLDFDQLDLVRVQVAAKYLTGQAATWGEGDWNGAPGGSPGSPPSGNGLFDQLDIIAALAGGVYLTGPYASLRPEGQAGDGQRSAIDGALATIPAGLSEQAGWSNVPPGGPLTAADAARQRAADPHPRAIRGCAAGAGVDRDSGSFAEPAVSGQGEVTDVAGVRESLPSLPFVPCRPFCPFCPCR